jgi:hypothetical protein
VGIAVRNADLPLPLWWRTCKACGLGIAAMALLRLAFSTTAVICLCSLGAADPLKWAWNLLGGGVLGEC